MLLTLNDDGSAAARRFHERVRNPLLTDITIDWNGLQVADVYPQRIPDLFSVKPVVLTGRYSSAGRATIRLKGKFAGHDFTREIPVELPETMASHDVLPSLWARARIDNLMAQNYAGAQHGAMPAELKDTITQLGIEYRLMTQFTSFVAVEEMIVTDGGQPLRVDVPIEVAERTMGAPVEEADLVMKSNNLGSFKRLPAKSRRVAGTGGGVGVGQGAGSAARASSPPSPRVMSVSQGVISGPAYGAGRLPDATTPERDEVGRKLHVSVWHLVERLRKQQNTPTAHEVKFVRDGKAEVQIWLTEKSDEALTQLKDLGFEVMLDPKSSKLIIGRIPIEKLEALAKLKFVRYVSPLALK